MRILFGMSEICIKKHIHIAPAVLNIPDQTEQLFSGIGAVTYSEQIRHLAETAELKLFPRVFDAADQDFGVSQIPVLRVEHFYHAHRRVISVPHQHFQAGILQRKEQITLAAVSLSAAPSTCLLLYAQFLKARGPDDAEPAQAVDISAIRFRLLAEHSRQIIELAAQFL